VQYDCEVLFSSFLTVVLVLQAAFPLPPENRPDLRNIIDDDAMVRSVTIWQSAGGQLVMVRGTGEVSFQSAGPNVQLLPTCRGTVSPQDVRRLLEVMVQRDFLALPRKTYLIVDGDEQDWRKLKLHSIGLKTAQGSVKRDFAAGEYDDKREELPRDFVALENAILELKQQAIPHDRPCSVAPPLWSEIKDAPPAQ
jgi:hypothetical protein